MRYVVALVVILVCWEIFPTVFDVPVFLFPKLSAVVTRIVSDRDVFIYTMGVTSRAILLSFFVAVALAAVLAYSVHLSRAVRVMFEPLILISQLIPRVALVPLVLVWFSYGLQSKVVVAVLICFFPIYEGLRSGLDLAPRELILRARLQGYSRFWSVARLRTPFALPSAFTGLRTGALFSVVGVVVAEFLASGDGAGIMIVERMARGDTPSAFGYMLLVTLVGVVLYGLVILTELALRTRLRI